MKKNYPRSLISMYLYVFVTVRVDIRCDMKQHKFILSSRNLLLDDFLFELCNMIEVGIDVPLQRVHTYSQLAKFIKQNYNRIRIFFISFYSFLLYQTYLGEKKQKEKKKITEMWLAFNEEEAHNFNEILKRKNLVRRVWLIGGLTENGTLFSRSFISIGTTIGCEINNTAFTYNTIYFQWSKIWHFPKLMPFHYATLKYIWNVDVHARKPRVRTQHTQ